MANWSFVQYDERKCGEVFVIEDENSKRSNLFEHSFFYG